MSQSDWGVVASLVVATVLLLAGVSKLAQPVQWQAQATGLGVARPVALVVPFGEVALGACLVVQLQRHLMAWLAVALFSAFTALLALRLAQGKRPPCACFGSLTSRPIGLGHLARNALFIGLAFLAATL